MTSYIRVGRGSKIAPKIGGYRVGHGRKVGQKWPKTSDVINGRSLSTQFSCTFSFVFFILSVIDFYVYHDVHMMLLYTYLCSSTYIGCKREDIHVKVKAHKVKPLAFQDLRCYVESEEEKESDHSQHFCTGLWKSEFKEIKATLTYSINEHAHLSLSTKKSSKPVQTLLL